MQHQLRPVTRLVLLTVLLLLIVPIVVANDHYNQLDTERDAYVRNADIVIGVIDMVYYMALVGVVIIVGVSTGASIVVLSRCRCDPFREVLG